jgi:hypothetical protein
VRFLRHLGAAALLVAVVVLLGLAWNHFAASSLVGGQMAAVKQFSGPAGPRGAGAVRPGPMNLGLSSMLEPLSLAVLRHTVVIEGVVIALVVMADVSRRLWRQERRAGQLARSRPADGDDDPDQ